MGKLASRPLTDLKITLELNYHEAAALEAMAGYGFDAFLEMFYENLGKTYLQPHEEGLKSLFDCVKETLPGIVNRFKNAQDVFAGIKQIGRT